MREGSSTLYYFVSDHLGSTALTLKQDGTVHSETRYKPFGETAWSSASAAPTRRRYTGQLQDFDLPQMQLCFYNARYYDPALARFTQADTIVPQPGNPQSFNRYIYVLNNPLKYTDSSGHCPDQACYEALWYAKDRWHRARGQYWNKQKKDWSDVGLAEVDNVSVAHELLSEAGIDLQGDWTDAQIIEAATGVGDLSRAVGGVSRLNKLIGGYATLYHPSEPRPFLSFDCGIWGAACAMPPPVMDGHSVYFKSDAAITKFVTVYELAHIIDYNSSIQYPFTYHNVTYNAWGTFSDAWGTYTTEYTYCWACFQSWERWADAVSLYVYGAAFPRRGARNLEPWESDIMNRLLLGHGW